VPIPSRRSTVVALATATSLSLLGDHMLYAVLPSRPALAGIEVAALGLVLSVHRFVRLAANPIAGLVYDRRGRRRPFLAGMALALASTTGYLVGDGLWPLVAARLIWGCAFALIFVGALAIVMDLTEPGDRGRTVGLYHALVGVGTALGPVVSGVLTDAVGYRGTLAIHVPLTALGLLIAVLALPETASEMGDSGRPPSPLPSAAPGDPGRPRPPVRLTAPGPAARGVGAATGLTPRTAFASLSALDRRLAVPAFVTFVNYFVGHGVLMATLGLLLQEQAARRDAAGAAAPLAVASLTGLLLGLRRVVTTVCSPLAGAAADRVGRRLVALGGAAASAGGLLVLVSAGSTAAIVLGVALVSAGESVIQPAVAAWVGDAAPARLRGAVMGVFAAISDLGGALGPLVAYALAAVAGLRSAYALSCLLMVAAVAVTLWGPRAGGARA
jgi:MFS family permease